MAAEIIEKLVVVEFACGVRKLAWDAFGRLYEVRRKSDNALVARYLYDADNRRVARTVTGGGIGEDSSLNGTTHFTYSGWRVIEELAVDGSTREGLHEFHWGNYLDESWARLRSSSFGAAGQSTAARANPGSRGLADCLHGRASEGWGNPKAVAWLRGGPITLAFGLERREAEPSKEDYVATSPRPPARITHQGTVPLGVVLSGL